MPPTGEDRNSEIVVEFLLEEFRQLNSAFLSNEQLGERRVNFFLTITIVLLGGMLTICQILGKIDKLVVLLSLLILILIGLFTLIRIIHRNLVTHKYLRAQGRIRRYFCDFESDLSKYLPYGPFDEVPQRRKKWNEIFSFGKGGLLEMVQLVNSLLFCSVFVLYLKNFGWIVGISIGLLSFMIAWSFQFIFIKYRYEKNKPKEKNIFFPIKKNSDY